MSVATVRAAAAPDDDWAVYLGGPREAPSRRSIDRCYPSMSGWVRPVQSSRELCTELYTAAGVVL